MNHLPHINYSIISINKTTDSEVRFHHENDGVHLPEPYSQDDSTPLYGQVFTVVISTVYEDCPVYYSLLCGSISGVHLLHCQANYGSLESYPPSLAFNVVNQLSTDFPHIIDHNLYSDEAEKAASYLISQGITAECDNQSVSVVLSKSVNSYLTRKDIQYFSELFDDQQTSEVSEVDVQ